MGNRLTQADGTKLRLLSLAEVRAAGISNREALYLIRQAYDMQAQGQAEVPLKLGTRGTRRNSFFDAMPARVGRVAGMKWVSYFPGNQAMGFPDSSGVIVLNHPENGMPVCIMEGMHITFLRTAACAAVLAERALRGSPEILSLIGCGGLGLWSARLLKAAFPSLRKVFVSSRTQRSRQDFCLAMASEADWELLPVNCAGDAVAQGDIVVSSVPPESGQPVRLNDFKPGAVFIPLDLVHAWQDDVLLRSERVITDSPEYLRHLVSKHRPAIAHALDSRPTITHDLAFVAVCGIASTDIVLAWEIYRRACAAGLGVELDLHASKPGPAASDPNGKTNMRVGI